MHKILTIAGSDCSGGAGIQADIKTVTAHRMYAMSAVTALTAQNTTGVFGIHEVSPDFLAQQLDCIFTDIFPDAVKIGMTANTALIKVISEKLKQYRAVNIVADPVMVSTSGNRLIEEEALNTLMTELLPLADIITPNLPEAEILLGHSIRNRADMEKAARELNARFGSAVIIKGGHLNESFSADLLFTKNGAVWFEEERIDNPNTHGTGCTFSSAIACNLAEGKEMTESIRSAKKYISGAIKANLDLGRGYGPLDHTYLLG